MGSQNESSTQILNDTTNSSQNEVSTQVLSDAKANLLAVQHHMEAVAHQQKSLTHKMSVRITKLILNMNKTTAVTEHSKFVNTAASNASKGVTVWIKNESNK